MKIEYDREADALYIQFREAFANDSMDVEEGVTVDLDQDGHIIGIEILDACKRFGPKAVANVTIKNLLAEELPSELSER